MSHDWLFNVFVFLAAACLIVPLASRFKLGSVLGFLMAGIMIGPYGLALISNSNEVMHFAEFGVIMMLFLIGLELEPAMLWRLKKMIIGLGGLQVVLTSLALTLMGLAFGYEWKISLTVGMALALSSTALVLQVLEEKNLMKTSIGQTSFAVLLFQDMAVIPLLVIIPLLAVHQVDLTGTSHASNGWIMEIPGWMHALIVSATIGAVVITGRYLSRYMFYAVAKTNLREVFTATSLMMVVGITLLMQFVGVSPALGAFIAGVMLANSEYKHSLEADIQPFKGLLLGLFFISVGMGMNFSLLLAKPMEVLGLVGMLMATKCVIMWVLGRIFGLTALCRIGFAMLLCQGGEFAFVLFQFATKMQILTADQSSFLILVVALSMALTPLLIAYYNRYIVTRFMSVVPERPFDEIIEKNPVILVGFGRFGQIIGRFIGAQGIAVTVLDRDPDQIELLRKFGFKGYFGDPAREEFLRSAGAQTAKILVVAVDDADSCIDIVKLAKKHFPHLKIFARARNRRHAYELHKAGVHYFRREMFDASLIMAQHVMTELGYKESDMQFKAARFTRHDEETLKQSFQFFDNEPDLISFARMAYGDLERVLQDDSADETLNVLKVPQDSKI